MAQFELLISLIMPLPKIATIVFLYLTVYAANSTFFQEKASVIGADNIVSLGEGNNIRGAHNRVQGKNNELKGDWNKVNGSHGRAEGNGNFIYGSSFLVEGNNNLVNAKGQTLKMEDLADIKLKLIEEIKHELNERKMEMRNSKSVNQTKDNKDIQSNYNISNSSDQISQKQLNETINTIIGDSQPSLVRQKDSVNLLEQIRKAQTLMKDARKEQQKKFKDERNFAYYSIQQKLPNNQNNQEIKEISQKREKKFATRDAIKKLREELLLQINSTNKDELNILQKSKPESLTETIRLERLIQYYLVASSIDK